MVQKHDRAQSGCIVIVEVEQAPNPLAPTDSPFASVGVRNDRIEQPIDLSLVVPPQVIVRSVRHDRLPKMLLTERYSSAEALLSKAPSLVDCRVTESHAQLGRERQTCLVGECREPDERVAKKAKAIA